MRTIPVQVLSHYPSWKPPVELPLWTSSAHDCVYLPGRRTVTRAFLANDIPPLMYHQFMDAGFQIVLCAGAPDTPEIAEEMKSAVEQAKKTRRDIIWIEEMVDKKTVIELYSHAAVFCCPSIYEPFGIINLEAMACGTPVVASAVGGIKEVVVDQETGFLVPLEQMKESPFEPLNPEKFSRDLAGKINQLMNDRRLREKFGKAGRKRVEEKFSWSTIAQKTKALYETLKR